MCGLLIGLESARAGSGDGCSAKQPPTRPPPQSAPQTPTVARAPAQATSRSRLPISEGQERTPHFGHARGRYTRLASERRSNERKMSANLPSSARSRAAAARPASARSSKPGVASVTAPPAKPPASVRATKAASTPSKAAAATRVMAAKPVAAPAKPQASVRSTRLPGRAQAAAPPSPDAALLAAKSLSRGGPRPLPCTAAPERMDLTGGLIDELLGVCRSGIEADSDFQG